MGTFRSVQFGIFLICMGIFVPKITAQLGCQQISILSTTFYTTAIRLEWSTNICALSYIVHQFVDGSLFAEFTVTNPVTFILLPKLNCSYNNIIIQTIAIPAAGLFPDVSTNFTIGYSECEEMEISIDVRDDSIEVTWTRNSCAFVYMVTHFANGVQQRTVSLPDPIVSTSIERLTCSRNTVTIDILQRPNTGIFIPPSKDFVVGFEGHTEVLHLQFNDDLRRFEWFPPIVPERCAEQIQYNVEFENENAREKFKTSNTYFRIPNHPCSTNRINITTLIGLDISQSEPVGATVVSPVSRKPAQHISTEAEVDRATVIWEIQSEPKNLCKIDAIVFDVTNDEDEILSFEKEISPDSSVITYVFEPLQPNTNYTYTACYIMASSDIRICSDKICFNTSYCESKLRVDQANDQFIVNWDQCSGRILGYTLRIQPIEPAHFVPANCHFDLSSTELIFSGSDITSYNFTGAEASFSYRVQLLTHYMGSTYTEEISVITNERTPGDLVIRTSYQGAPSSPYDVTLKTSWNIPCNVNGRVQRFDYVLTGTLNSRSIVSCRDIELSSGSIDVVEGQVAFKAFIPDIIPSFNHTLRVTTVLMSREGTTIVDLGAAPPAYTSPNWQCTSWIY